MQFFSSPSHQQIAPGAAKQTGTASSTFHVLFIDHGGCYPNHFFLEKKNQTVLSFSCSLTLTIFTTRDFTTRESSKRNYRVMWEGNSKLIPRHSTLLNHRHYTAIQPQENTNSIQPPPSTTPPALAPPLLFISSAAPPPSCLAPPLPRRLLPPPPIAWEVVCIDYGTPSASLSPGAWSMTYV